jgi:putative flippase GtrA
MDIFQHPDNGEIARYLVSGLSAVATDMVIYWFFLPVMGPSAAKAMSFICGTVVSYNLNKHWTFKRRKHSWSEVTRFASLYGFTLLTNVSVNHLLLSSPIPLLDMPPIASHRYQFAWLAATGTCTIINYLGQKFWVFRSHNLEPGESAETAP